MIPTPNNDHVAEARALITDQFRGRRVIQGLLDACVNRVQELDDVALAVILSRLLDNAANAQLDSLGDLVGEPRLARDDSDYKAAIRIRIRVNRTQGKAEDVIQVVNLALPNAFVYRDLPPAAFEVEAYELTTPLDLAKAINQTRAVATYGTLVTGTWSLPDVFRFDYPSGGVSDPGLWDYDGTGSASSDVFSWATVA